MANEVIIEEYSAVGIKIANSVQNQVPIPGKFITSQVLDIAEASAAFAATTSWIRLRSKGTGFWFILGGASPAATANTDGNRWLPADQFVDLAIEANVELKLDTAA